MADNWRWWVDQYVDGLKAADWDSSDAFRSSSPGLDFSLRV